MSQAVMKRRRWVSGIVIGLEERDAGTAQGRGAVHGPRLVLRQHPLRGKLLLAPISRFQLG